MILNYILSELPWTKYGIQCSNPNEALLVNKFMREAILDRHIYISKVVGFTIKTNNTFRPYVGTYIARHKQIGDSYPELMLNLQDKVFINTDLTRLGTVITTGDNTMQTNVFGDLRDVTVKTLYTNDRICRCLDKEAILELILVYGCGYYDMQHSSSILTPEYFPCNVDFYLGDFFRVLPPRRCESTVQIRYFNGATEEDLKDILTKWFVTTQTNCIVEEEKLWLSSFGR